MPRPGRDVEASAATPPGGRSSRLGDRLFAGWTGAMALGLVGLLVLLLAELIFGGWRTIDRFGLGFLMGRAWNPVRGREAFGALPFIFGTLVTSAVAVALAVPVAVGLALLLNEVRGFVRNPLASFVDVLAAIPSVVFGLWGLFVLKPFLDQHVEPAMSSTIGTVPVVGALFRGNPNGPDLFTAGVILAIMILPIVTAVTREVVAVVPRELREGALALGATRYESIRMAVLPYARNGVVGATMLGLGRALGETIAVSMVVGNVPSIGTSLFEPGATIPSWIASSFREATSVGLHRSALMALAVVLVIVAFVLAALSRLLVWRAASPSLRRDPRSGGDRIPQGDKLIATVEIAPMGRVRAWRRWKDRAFTAFLWGCAFLAMVPLVLISVYVVSRGWHALSVNFFTKEPAGPLDPSAGGIAQSFVGTGLIVGTSTLFSVPLGVLTAVYLAEYGRGRFAGAVRLIAEVLLSTPSIVAGVFIWSLVVVAMRTFSALAAALALTVLMWPVIARAAEEILRLVPQELREGALALGLPRWKVILRVVVPTAGAGILTAIMLAVARGLGETAPILLTALGNDFINTNPLQPTDAVPLRVFTDARTPVAALHEFAWGGALMLLVAVLGLSIAARVLSSRQQKRMA